MAEKTSIPWEGALAILRNSKGLITSVQPSGSPNGKRVHMVSIEYTKSSRPLEVQVDWEREIDARIIETTILPPIISKPPRQTKPPSA